ncbi:CHASE2 domain-containing protein [Spirulina sp. CS-785/01]|uniref:CHASE2 domain-containing protein n=1 Tax=Spirulina sp. CS-785/01 TaxID=3021716 RepID=UPI00232E2618|nr:CHASE2 domain-containing protein [Spirulina sp. CS-785/01]MDB9315420.1 CHASE2 domain-containing protein [Spirulina sp. CS-785/01]
MTKRVLLELDGNLTTGVRVTLEIYSSPQSNSLKIKGSLPPNPELEQCLHYHWQENYRTLGAPYRWTWRIKPKKVIHKGSINQKIKVCQQSAKRLCEQLEEWLDCETFRPIDRRLREQLDPTEAVRFWICTDNLQLRKLPWQEWEIFQQYSLVEPSFCSLESQPLTPPVSSPSLIKILVILGHDQGIDTEKDRKLLNQLPHADPVFLVQPQRQEITDQLWEQSWDIIFFAGHSETQGETGVIYINPDECLTIDELWYGLKKACDRGLQLAIFNSCDGLGLSQKLDDLLIPQMIVMRELVPDQVAQQFLRYFLTNFAQGQSFYLAVREARQRLYDELEYQFPCASWLPVICQNPSAIPPSWTVETAPIVPPVPHPIETPNPIQWGGIVLSSLIATLGVLGVRSLGFLQLAEWKAYDYLVRFQPPETLETRLLVVEITDRDLNLFKPQREGSIDDDILYELLKKINTANPRAIGLFLLRDGRFDIKLKALNNYIKNNSKIQGICTVGDKDSKGYLPPQAFPLKRQTFDNVIPDPDQVVRRQLLLTNPPLHSNCHAEQSFGLKMAQLYLEAEGINVTVNQEDNLQLDNLEIPILTAPQGVYQQADTWGHQILLNYHSHQSPVDFVERVSITDILSDSVPSQYIENRLVIIGVNHENAKFYPTPYGVQIPGILLQAQQISNLLRTALDDRPYLRFITFPIQLLLLWGTALIGGLLSQLPTSWKQQLLIALSFGGLLIAVCYTFLLQGYWLPFIPLLLTGLISAIIVNSVFPSQPQNNRSNETDPT